MPEHLPSDPTDITGPASDQAEPAIKATPSAADLDDQLDPAQQSLAEALRVSFGILKVAMFGLLIAYLLSGTIDQRVLYHMILDTCFRQRITQLSHLFSKQTLIISRNDNSASRQIISQAAHYFHLPFS